MAEPNVDLLYGYDEIGAYLGLTGVTVKSIAEKDSSDIPIFNIGRRRCALKSRLDAWLAAKATQRPEDGDDRGGE